MSETTVAAKKVTNPATGLPAVLSASNDAFLALGAGDASRCRQLTGYVEWGSGVTSGAIMMESAPHENYTGTWKSHATITFGGTAPNTDTAQVLGPLGAVRFRVSTVIAGGSAIASVWVFGN